MKTIPITDSEITSTIASLKSKNSSGYGGILKKNMPKFCAEYLGRTFVHIYSGLLALYKFSDCFNYSLLTHYLKLMESLYL